MVLNKLILILGLLSGCLFLQAQTFSTLSSTLIQRNGIDSIAFNESFQNADLKKLKPDDEVLKYDAWITSLNPTYFTNKNSYFKTFYFVEKARINRAFENFDAAYVNIDSALSCFNHKSFPAVYSHIINYGSQIAGDKADFRTANHFLIGIINSGLFKSDSLLTANTWLALAKNSLNLHHYKETMRYCELALPIFNGLKDIKARVRILILMHDASYLSTKDAENTDYLLLASELALQTKDSLLISDVYTTRGKAAYRNGDQKTAIKFYKVARQFAAGVSKDAEISSMIYLRLSYALADSVDAACNLSEQILEYVLKYGRKTLLGNAYNSRAWCFAQRGQKDSAIYYMDKAEHFRELYGIPDASPGFYYYMHQVALLAGDYPRALRYLRKSTDQNMRIAEDNSSEDLSEIRAKFDYELQKERITKLRFENQLEHKNNVIQRIVLIGALILLALLVVFFMLLRRQFGKLKSSYAGLVRKNLELDKLNTRLADEENCNDNHNGDLVIKNEESICRKLKFLMEAEKVFRQQDLTIGRLAEMVGTNTTYLSAIINKRYEMSFKKLLNLNRINEARRLMVQDEYAGYSVEGIAYEVGYQSRSAFYQVFKEITGLTPTDYIKGYHEIGNAPKVDSDEESA
jgi:AraC-like DNA-binding protein